VAVNGTVHALLKGEERHGRGQLQGQTGNHVVLIITAGSPGSLLCWVGHTILWS
jgi:hypothetical protein